ncbi:MAG: hypothetical protein WAX69_18185 [Victivallales bacterium]
MTRIKYLSSWEKELDLQMLADLEGSLPRIEMKLRELQQVKRAARPSSATPRDCTVSANGVLSETIFQTTPSKD